MIQTLKKSLYTGYKKLRNDKVAVLCIVLAIAVLATPTAAVVQETYTDDFENGNVDGWVGTDPYPEINNTSAEGDYSAYAKTVPEGESGNIEWREGPVLDLQEEFTVNATFRQNNIDNTDLEVRIGVTSDSPNTEGENALVLFDREEDITYLGTYAEEPTPTDSSNTIDSSFNDQWVSVKITSNGDGSLSVKVWQYGTGEPTDAQLNRTFEGTSGQFGFNVGNEDSQETSTREALLDSVTIDGTEATDPQLRFDSRNFIKHGEKAGYTVSYTEETPTGNQTKDVTDNENTTVESLNESVVTVDETQNTLIATSDESVNDRVRVRSQYNGSVTYHNVTVSSPTVENLEILPAHWRLGALLGSNTFQMILVGLLLAIAATRFSTSFGGIAIYQMTLTAGWFIGYVSVGMAMVSLFASLFIGLNLAANIDYGVRR